MEPHASIGGGLIVMAGLTSGPTVDVSGFLLEDEAAPQSLDHTARPSAVLGHQPRPSMRLLCLRVRL